MSNTNGMVNLLLVENYLRQAYLTPYHSYTRKCL